MINLNFKKSIQEYPWVHPFDPFYPFIKYKIPADPKLDGTDYFVIAESTRWRGGRVEINVADDFFAFFLSFNCENDEKAFYKLIQDC